MRVVSTEDAARTGTACHSGSSSVLGVVPADSVAPASGSSRSGPPSSSGSARSDPRSFRTSGTGGDHSRAVSTLMPAAVTYVTVPTWSALEAARQRLAAAGITVGNFQVDPVGRRVTDPGRRLLAASPRVRPGLRAAGFDLLSLANNHVGDYGDGALRQTLARFDSGRIETVGAGRNLDAARRPVIIERDGVQVGFLAVDSIGETPAATRTRQAPIG